MTVTHTVASTPLPGDLNAGGRRRRADGEGLPYDWDCPGLFWPRRARRPWSGRSASSWPSNFSGQRNCVRRARRADGDEFSTGPDYRCDPLRRDRQLRRDRRLGDGVLAKDVASATGPVPSVAAPCHGGRQGTAR